MQTLPLKQPFEKGQIQAVIFDLDGVLMDSEWLSFKIWQAYAKQYGGNLPDEAYPPIIGLTAEETAEYVMQQSGASFDMAESCTYIWDTMIEQLRREIDPLPGAALLVHDLFKAGYPLAIASNSPTNYINSALSGLKMELYFRVRVGIDQVRAGKPAPDVYLRAAQRLNITPQRCLAIEDSRVGVQAAAAAGMRVLAVPARHDKKDGFDAAWKIFDSLEEVLPALDKVLS